MTRDRSNSNCLFLGELLFQHCPLFAAMASLCPGTYIGVFRASTEAAPPATISSIIIMAIITYTTAITSITYRCLTTTTGTTRATKAATTPSPHSADSGIVRLGFLLTLLITYFSKWLCWAENNLKVCLELGRQGDIQELQRPERTGRWQLPKKRGVLEFLCFLSNTYTSISYTVLRFTISFPGHWRRVDGWSIPIFASALSSSLELPLLSNLQIIEIHCSEMSSMQHQYFATYGHVLLI